MHGCLNAEHNRTLLLRGARLLPITLQEPITSFRRSPVGLLCVQPIVQVDWQLRMSTSGLIGAFQTRTMCSRLVKKIEHKDPWVFETVGGLRLPGVPSLRCIANLSPWPTTTKQRKTSIRDRFEVYSFACATTTGKTEKKRYSRSP